MVDKSAFATTIEIKNFYLEDIKQYQMGGVIITSHCPTCNTAADWGEGDNDYLSYPKGNAEEEIQFYCGDCEEHFYETFRFNFTPTITRVGNKRMEP